MLRIAHLSPDTPALDAALAPAADPGAVLTDPGPPIVGGLAYGDVSAYRELPPGAWAVSVRAAGAPAGTPPALSLRVELDPGQARTVTVGGTFADLALDAVPDDLTAPPTGSARVRVLAAAATAPSLSLTLDTGQVLADGLAFPGSGPYVAVRAGSYRVRASGTAGGAPVQLAAGSVATVLALDAPDGGTTLRVVLDAAGPAQSPVGGVEAGAGPATTGSGAGAVLAALALAALAGRRRVGLVAVTAVMAPALLLGSGPDARGVPAALPVVHPPVSTAPADPARVRVPAAGIDSTLTGARLDGTGALEPPADPAVAGWFTGGPRPGEPGPAVVTGHVDWAGHPGALAGLAGVAPGDEVLVDRTDGTVARFSVTRVERYAKASFPGDRVYAPTPAPELRLITCGGPFDAATGSYRDNVVVYAEVR